MRQARRSSGLCVRAALRRFPVLSYIVWAVAIGVCFYLGARLTFQVRERKKKQLRIDFDQAKEREKDGRL